MTETTAPQRDYSMGGIEKGGFDTEKTYAKVGGCSSGE